MEEIIPSVAILVYKGDDVLLVCHTENADHVKNTYGLPAGRLNENETEIEAAVRELEEETGLVAKVEDLIKLPQSYSALIPRKDGPDKKFSMKVFVCSNYQGDPVPCVETIPVWKAITYLSELTLLPNTLNAIQQGLDYR